MRAPYIAPLVLFACVPPKVPPNDLASASLLPGTFTMFVVEQVCAPDDTPTACDPVAMFPIRVSVATTLLGTFVPSDAMCGPFEIAIEVDRTPSWSGTVPGGGKANAVGTFALGRAEAGAHLVTISAKSAHQCYRQPFHGWSGTFTIAASDQRLPVLSAIQPPTPAPSVTPPAAPSRGRDVFSTCEPCHGPDGAGRQGMNAPTIASQEPWYLERQIKNFQTGRRGTHDNDLYGMQMRPMALTLTDPAVVKDVVTYIHGLPAPRHPRTIEGDVKRGEALFLVCAVCHNENGAGNVATGAPKLTIQQDWYLVRQIMNFRDQLRGYHADDRYGAEMRVVTGNLEDEQAARDVVAYIQTLRDKPATVASATPAPALVPEPEPEPTPPVAAPPIAPPAAKVVAPTEPKTVPAPKTAPVTPKTAPVAPKAATPTPPAAPAGPSLAELKARGEGVYTKICAPCHQANGQGIPGAFPPLAGAGAFYGSPKKHAGIIINGLTGSIVVKGVTYNGAMPPQGSLSDLDIAAVATFERNSWGNNDGIVTPADVAAAR